MTCVPGKPVVDQAPPSGREMVIIAAGLTVVCLVAAMILEYVVMMNSDPGYDRDEELAERIVRFVG